MGILCRLALLISGCPVLQLHSRFLQNLGCSLVMEFDPFMKLLNQTDGFGCGFLFFGCFSQVFNLFFISFLFLLGLKFLNFKGASSAAHYLSNVREKNGNFDAFDRKDPDCNDGFVKNPRNVDGFDRKGMISLWKIDAAAKSGRKKKFSTRFCSECELHDGFGRKKNMTGEERNRGVSALPETEIDENDDVAREKDNEEGFPSDEDEVVDVITLRKMVKRERNRGDSLYTELEKERVAAASAAEEAMAMLLRLQSEKSSVEMEAKQYKRIAEQKQIYDQEVIQGLQWMVTKHEEARDALEDKLRLCVQKLKMHSNGDGETDFDGFLESSMDGGRDQRNIIVGSPEIESEGF
ncbi:PREDICTED: uncharacterized protein LOC104807189 [Tarenaya hassleriana]|uniref:uncharacterized protein LOC104807189 n=1 Tax=Tarenaya hassleriana TaxID=28532 RepID=UPI00053C967F|nr:PREDICTED: uncharacterized protein LOC104807189 [Tarenaya hassleriana]